MAVSTREIRSLTGLRGLAACYVMLYHFSFHAFTGIARRLVQHGYLSVDLFFVLSGFVMTLTYGPRFCNRKNVRSYTEFMQKRFARVYPLYLFITVLTFIAIRAHMLSGTWASPRTFGKNLLLLQALGLADSICPPSWSICTEFIAYLFFPFLVGVIAYRRRSWSWLTMLAAIAVMCLIASMSSERLHEGLDMRHGALDIYAPGTPYPLLRCLAEFIMGVTVFGLSRNRSFTGKYWGVATDLLVLATLGLLLLDRADAILVVLYPLLVLLISLEQGVAVRVFSSRVIHWLGLISYSIYLDHFLLHQLFSDRLKERLTILNVPNAGFVRGMFLIIATVFVAAMTYYTIERPSRTWFGRTPGKPSEP